MRQTEMGIASVWVEGDEVRLKGRWTAGSLDSAVRQLSRKILPGDGELEFDLCDVTAMDTAGAWLVYRLVKDLRSNGREVRVERVPDSVMGMLALVAGQSDPREVDHRRRTFSFLEETGRRVFGLVEVWVGYLDFLGRMARKWIDIAVRPRHWRWHVIVDVVEATGVDAVPIIGLLSFLIGVVVAYQGIYVLRTYGAVQFVANLSGVSILRELGPLLTAIVVAGRTGSAFTAQLGTMKVTEEIDALYAMGVSPIEVLVLPRVFGLAIALPLLTVWADVMGIFGSAFTASLVGGIHPQVFMGQLVQAINPGLVLTGLAKTPVFAATIASVGCYHGFQAAGNAESVGKRTTSSVVQSIFLVIVIDAAFSVAYSMLRL